MRNIVQNFYDTHKNYDVILNQEIIDSLGLVPSQLSLKISKTTVPCIIYSTSMVSSRIIVELNQINYEKLRNNAEISLRFTFYIKHQKQTISFYINSKIISCEEYDSEKPDLYFILLEFTKTPPTVFIEILGTHIKDQLLLQKRSQKRVIIGSGNNNMDPGLIEAFLFIAGNGKKCVLTEISLFSAKLLASGKDDDFIKGTNVLLLMKTKKLEGIGEMLGNIERVEVINKDEGLYSIIIVFDQDKIPPTYKMWVAECIEKFNF